MFDLAQSIQRQFLLKRFLVFVLFLYKLYLLFSFSLLFVYDWREIFPRRSATWLERSFMTQRQVHLPFSWRSFLYICIKIGLRVRCKQLFTRVSCSKWLLFLLLLLFLPFLINLAFLLAAPFWWRTLNISKLFILLVIYLGLEANEDICTLSNNFATQVPQILFLPLRISLTHILIRGFNSIQKTHIQCLIQAGRLIYLLPLPFFTLFQFQLEFGLRRVLVRRSMKGRRSVGKVALLDHACRCCTRINVSRLSMHLSIRLPMCQIAKQVRMGAVVSVTAAVCEGRRLKQPNLDLDAINSASLTYCCLSLSMLLILPKLEYNNSNSFSNIDGVNKSDPVFVLISTDVSDQLSQQYILQLVQLGSYDLQTHYLAYLVPQQLILVELVRMAAETQQNLVQQGHVLKA